MKQTKTILGYIAATGLLAAMVYASNTGAARSPNPEEVPDPHPSASSANLTADRDSLPAPMQNPSCSPTQSPTPAE